MYIASYSYSPTIILLYSNIRKPHYKIMALVETIDTLWRPWLAYNDLMVRLIYNPLITYVFLEAIYILKVSIKFLQSLNYAG